MDAGDLAAGASRTGTIQLKATEPGVYTFDPMATADGDLKASGTAVTTTVLQPVLALGATGPDNRFIGRSFTHEFTVTNKGDGPAANTMVECTLPADAQDVAASSGGTVSGKKVVWQLGTLAPKASKAVSVTMTSAAAGSMNSMAAASAKCAMRVAADAKTVITGISAVLLEVVDVADPIEVGANETYVITVTNQGSAPDTNVQITCTLEKAMQFVSASGATQGRNEAGVIKFAPLPTLAPKAKATWQVIVKAGEPGDVRFKAVMNSDQLGRPVEETEATKFYQ